MILGKVVGTVVSTQKDEGLEGLKLLIVQSVEMDLRLGKSFVVAADAIGAGMGEIVLVVQGSSARMASRAKGRPLDASIIAIVDSVEIGGQLIYQKGSS